MSCTLSKGSGSASRSSLERTNSEPGMAAERSGSPSIRVRSSRTDTGSGSTVRGARATSSRTLCPSGATDLYASGRSAERDRQKRSTSWDRERAVGEGQWRTSTGPGTGEPEP